MTELQEAIRPENDDLTETQLADNNKAFDAYWALLSGIEHSFTDKYKNKICKSITYFSDNLNKLRQAKDSGRKLEKTQSELTSAADRLYNCRNELSSVNSTIKRLSSKLPDQREALNRNIASFTDESNKLLTKYEQELKDSIRKCRSLCNVLSDDFQMDISEKSDLKKAEADLDWISQFKKEINGFKVFDEFIMAVCEKNEEILSLLREKAEVLKEWKKDFSKETLCFFELFEKKTAQELSSMPLLNIYRQPFVRKA